MTMNGDLETLLSAYVDGELDAEAVAEVEVLLAGDAQARRVVEMYSETAALLRAAMAEGFFAAGEPVLPAAVPALVRPVRSGWPVSLAMAAAIAACVVGFGGGLGWSRWTASELDHLLDEVAEYHVVYSRETTHLVEIPAERSDELKRWLGHRLERRLDIPDLVPAGLHFAGGRMLVVDGKPMADLLYTRDRGAPVALCIVQSNAPADDIHVERRHGQRIAVWHDGSYAYFIVGDLDPGMARGIAERVAEQIRG